MVTLATLICVGWQLPADSAGLYYGPAEGRLSSHYGWRTDPMNGRKRFHSGIDIAAPHGTPVYATQDGVVAYSGRYKGYGNIVVIQHSKTLSTLYAHNSKLLVRRGQTVRHGQLISRVGSTGRSTGPHLHFEVHQKKQYMNPMTYLGQLAQSRHQHFAKGSATNAAPAKQMAKAGHHYNPTAQGGPVIEEKKKNPTPTKRTRGTVEVIRDGKKTTYTFR
ncbi:MAG: M23 family metallopeptidase [Vampirovibrio sp.]|nr:M23 family metallopeptidase [Vampirovibrio sp.]